MHTDIISYLAGHLEQWGRPAAHAAGIHNEVLSILVSASSFFLLAPPLPPYFAHIQPGLPSQPFQPDPRTITRVSL